MKQPQFGPMSERAWLFGGAEYVAKNRLNAVLERVAEKLEAQMENSRGHYAPTADAPNPTDAELAQVRERYLELQAIAEAAAAARKIPEPGYWEFLSKLLKGIYRLTLFAAALTILHRFG